MNTKKKRRLLIFSTTYIPFIGGAEIAVREIIKRIPEYDVDILTVNLDGRQPKKEYIDNACVHRIGSGRLGKILFPIRACLRACMLHKQNPYDVTWSIMASHSGFAGLFFSYIHPKIPWVLTLQEGDTHEELRQRFASVWPLFVRIFRRARIVQAISKYLAEFAQSITPKTPVVVIPNGVDVAVFEKADVGRVEMVQNMLHKKTEDVFLVTTSRLAKKNGIVDCITSLLHLPQHIHLIIIGDGTLRQSLTQHAQHIGVAERVLFVGHIDPKDIPVYLHASDIFVRPSLSEGFGNSFIEAMAAGIPVIATPVGGIVDFLEDTKTGLFCQVNAPESIAQCVLRLLDDDKLRSSIIAQAKEMVTKTYDWNTISQKMQEDVFEVVLQ